MQVDSKAALQFLEDLDVPLPKVVQAGGHSRPRTHCPASGPVGGVIMKHLSVFASSLANVSIRTSVRVCPLTGLPHLRPRIFYVRPARVLWPHCRCCLLTDRVALMSVWKREGGWGKRERERWGERGGGEGGGKGGREHARELNWKCWRRASGGGERCILAKDA